MNSMIKQSVKPQASRLSFLLLALVMLGFGAFAQHTAAPTKSAETAQSFVIKH